MKITIMLEEDEGAWIAEIEDTAVNGTAYGNTPQEALDKVLAIHLEYLTEELRALKKGRGK